MADMYDYIERKYMMLLDRAQRLAWSVARFTSISKSSGDGESDKVEGQPSDSTDPGYGGQKTEEDARRLAGAWGVWSVPPAGEPAAVVRAGGGKNNAMIVACGGKKYAPSGVNDGETVLYCKKTGCTVKLDQNGGITITAASGQAVNVNAGAGANVVLNSGALNVARRTDTAGPYPIVGGAPNVLA